MTSKLFYTHIFWRCKSNLCFSIWSSHVLRAHAGFIFSLKFQVSLKSPKTHTLGWQEILNNPRLSMCEWLGCALWLTGGCILFCLTNEAGIHTRSPPNLIRTLQKLTETGWMAWQCLSGCSQPDHTCVAFPPFKQSLWFLANSAS